MFIFTNISIHDVIQCGTSPLSLLTICLKLLSWASLMSFRLLTGVSVKRDISPNTSRLDQRKVMHSRFGQGEVMHSRLGQRKVMHSTFDQGMVPFWQNWLTVTRGVTRCQVTSSGGALPIPARSVNYFQACTSHTMNNEGQNVSHAFRP